MSNDQPLALRLADLMESDNPEFDHCVDAAAELRRQHSEIARLRAALDDAHAAESVAQAAAEALRADAERYRWLRAQIERQRFVIAESCVWDGLKSWSGDSPDKRIDAARK